MQILNISQYHPLKPGAVALGFFDGVHLGHQALIARAVSSAHKLKGVSMVFTFPQHPESILGPKPVSLLSTFEERCARIAALGVDLLIWDNFTAAFAACPPENFIAQYLVKTLRAKTIVVGVDYTFGHHGKGEARDLLLAARKSGFEVILEPALCWKGSKISSSLIRELLKKGEVETAATLLGEPYTLSGTVVAGKGKGRTLGFPTANIDFNPDKLLPASGVYRVEVRQGERIFSGAANIGVNPTFNRRSLGLEVFVLNFSGELLGQTLTLKFLQRIREERRFDSIAALQAQIQKDVATISGMPALNPEILKP